MILKNIMVQAATIPGGSVQPVRPIGEVLAPSIISFVSLAFLPIATVGNILMSSKEVNKRKIGILLQAFNLVLLILRAILKYTTYLNFAVGIAASSGVRIEFVLFLLLAFLIFGTLFLLDIFLYKKSIKARNENNTKKDKIYFILSRAIGLIIAYYLPNMVNVFYASTI